MTAQGVTIRLEALRGQPGFGDETFIQSTAPKPPTFSQQAISLADMEPATK
jgi:predicted kinase